VDKMNCVAGTALPNMTDPSSTTTSLSSSIYAPNGLVVPTAALLSRDMNCATTTAKDQQRMDGLEKNKPKKLQPDRNLSSRDNLRCDSVAEVPSLQWKDDRLPDHVQQDPRGNGTILERMTQKATKRGNGRNTESFDPNSTLIRPDIRVLVGNPSHSKFQETLTHDDVVIVPEMFGPQHDWTLYYRLVEELTQLQQDQVKGSEFISWHEGTHLICKEPQQSKTFQMILQRLCDYFDMDATSVGTRFNWYKDSQDWKVRIRNIPSHMGCKYNGLFVYFLNVFSTLCIVIVALSP
jgi:hypothetical protein